MRLTTAALLLSLAFPATAFGASAISLSTTVDQVSLRPGESQFVTVTVSNAGVDPATVPVDVVLHWDLAKSREVGHASVTVPGSGSGTANFAFPAGPALFGYEVRATDSADVTVAPAGAFFTVHRNLWQVSMQGSGLRGHGLDNPLATQADRLQTAAGARSSLNNHLEFFAWAPDDFSTLDPPANVWYAGQTSYPASKLALHETIDALHAAGATVSAYAKGQMGGPAAFEFFRTHPEWTGAPYNSTWNVFDLKEYATKSPFNEGEQHWPRAMCDFGSWPIAQYHIDQLKAAADEFRFDAVRYDDHLQVGWVNDGYNPMSARNMEQIIAQLRAERPYFGFGFNWTTGDTKPLWDRHGGQPTPDWPIAGAAGSQIMDEEVGQIYGNARPAQGAPWTAYVQRLLADRALTEPYGGKVFVMQAPSPLGPVDSTYRNALVLALRLFHTNFDAGAAGQFARFATRYASLLRSDGCTPLTPDQITISAGQPLWGGTMAYRYPTEAGHGRIVVHLLNPPGDTLGAPGSFGRGGAAPAFPPPVQNVRVHLQLPSGWTATSATAIDAATLVNTGVPAVGARLDLAVPAVDIWSVVVIDCEVAQ